MELAENLESKSKAEICAFGGGGKISSAIIWLYECVRIRQADRAYQWSNFGPFNKWIFLIIAEIRTLNVFTCSLKYM